MNIDDCLIRKYLADQEITNRSHWVYETIEPNKVLFEETLCSRTEINDLFMLVLATLNDFEPVNKPIVTELFPDFNQKLTTIPMVLSVGVPNPYDTFTRMHQGQEYLILDLSRLAEYKWPLPKIQVMLRELLTHEVIHLCLHTDYPNFGETYEEKLRYIAFDEGFAHLLSHQDDIFSIDFNENLFSYYGKSKKRFTEALLVNDKTQQNELLREADSGPYWEKFGAIYGMLTLLKSLDQIKKIYQSGPTKFLME